MLYFKEIFFSLMFFASSSLALTLDEAIKISLDTHPLIKSKKADFGSSVSDLDVAKWQRWFNFSAQTQRLSSKEPGYNNQNGLTASVEQPLYTGGKISGGIDEADAKLYGAREAIAEAFKQVSIKVVDAYGNCLKYLQKVKYSEQNVVEHNRLYKSIQNRLTSGVSSEADVSLARARLNQANSELSQFKISLQNSLSALSILMSKKVIEKDIEAFNFTPNYGSLDELTATVIKNSPTLRRLEYEIKQAESDKEIKKSALYPQVSMRYERYAGLAQEINGDRSRVFLVANMQTGAGFSTVSSLESAEQKILSAKSSFESGKLDISEQLTSQYNEMRNYLSQVDDARDYVEQSDKVASSYERQYIIGKRSWFDLLNSKKEAVDAKYNFADMEIGSSISAKKLAILIAEESVK